MKGYQKRVIYLKNTGSHLFDEAYFVVSREGECAAISEGDMVLEANRIIEESLDSEERQKKTRKNKIADFIVPFFFGALISTAICFLSFMIFI